MITSVRDAVPEIVNEEWHETYHTSDVVLAYDTHLGWVFSQYVFSQVFEEDLWYFKAVSRGMENCVCDGCELTDVTHWMPLPDVKEFA